jgi:hypothetical protein
MKHQSATISELQKKANEIKKLNQKEAPKKLFKLISDYISTFETLSLYKKLDLFNISLNDEPTINLQELIKERKATYKQLSLADDFQMQINSIFKKRNLSSSHLKKAYWYLKFISLAYDNVDEEIPNIDNNPNILFLFNDYYFYKDEIDLLTKTNGATTNKPFEFVNVSQSKKAILWFHLELFNKTLSRK